MKVTLFIPESVDESGFGIIVDAFKSSVNGWDVKVSAKRSERTYAEIECPDEVSVMFNGYLTIAIDKWRQSTPIPK